MTIDVKNNTPNIFVIPQEGMSIIARMDDGNNVVYLGGMHHLHVNQ
jgi:hypothetical protein